MSPPVGADKVALKDGDRVLWYYANFGPTGGPPTLFVKASKKGCYVAQAFDDAGKAATVSGLVVHSARSGRSRRSRTSTSVRAAPGRARARDGHRRRPLERGEVRRALLLLLALTVTGCGGAREHGSATLWVTRDRGAEVVYSGTVPAGLTAMQALDRKLDITTRYGGRFVQSINDVEAR